MFIKRFFLLLLLPVAGFAQSGGPLLPERTSVEPVIDGILTDSIWVSQEPMTGFSTFWPDWGIEHDYKTEVFTAYDDKNLYFAFNCYGDPDEIKTSVAARDNIRADDWVCINLDSYNDQQSLYAIYVNPSGIQMDTRFASGEEDPGVDIVFYSAGKIYDWGYSIEAKIPFKSIRYSRRDGDVSMGVIFERRISREGMNSSLPALDPDMGFNFLIQMKEIVYRDIPYNTLVEVLPFVTYADNDGEIAGAFDNSPGKMEAGVTGKLGVTSDMILDLTYNPDFSQVESDARQVDDNQRFAIFYPERRPFFMEGSENFNFSSTTGVGLRSAVNTRTIVNPLFSAKLSGRIGNKNRIAGIFASDEINDGAEGRDPKAQVSVLRYRRAFNQDSYIGALYTLRKRDNELNGVLGIDGNFRLNDKSTLSAHAVTSQNRENTSENIIHDYAISSTYNFQTRPLDITANITDVSNSFNSQIGFMGRVGVTAAGIEVVPKLFFNRKYFQRIDNILSVNQAYDKPGMLWEKEYSYTVAFRWVRNTSLMLGGSIQDEIFLGEKFNRNNLMVRAASQINRRVYFSSRYSFGNQVRYSINPYRGSGSNYSGQLNLQLTDNFNSQFLYNYSDFIRDSDGGKDFTRTIIRTKNTYQLNKYLFFRIIAQYDSRFPEITADYLASFTFIPGTVVHFGYGSLYNRHAWDQNLEEYIPNRIEYHEFKRSLFFKASYLWRMK